LVNGQFTLGLGLYERGRDKPVWMTAFSATTNAVVDLERRGLEALALRLGLRLSMTNRTQMNQVLTNNLEAMRFMREAEAIYVRRGGTMAGYNEVFALAQKAVEIAPRSSAGRNVLGRVLLNRDDVEGAIRNLEEGARIAPLSREMHFELARAYARAGRKEDAAREREIFKKLEEATRPAGETAEPGANAKPPE